MMAANAYQWPSERVKGPKAYVVNNNDPITKIHAKLEFLTRQLTHVKANAVSSPVESCNFYSEPNQVIECHLENPNSLAAIEQAKFVGNVNR